MFECSLSLSPSPLPPPPLSLSLSLGPVGPLRVGFTEGQYQVSESATVVEVQVELMSGESEVTLNVFTVDGTASGMESIACLLHNTVNAGEVFN